MNIRRRLENHYRRWNISFDQAEQFRQLRNRVRSVLDSTIGRFIAENTRVDREFAEILGEDVGVAEYRTVLTPTMRAVQQVQGQRKRAFGATRVCEAIDESENLKQLVTALQVLFIILEVHHSSSVETLVRRLRSIVGLTPVVDFRVAQRGKSVTLYPAGAKTLDEALVNEVLTWLTEYPKVARPYEQALKTYMEGDVDNYRSLFDNLRRALEELLLGVLENKKSLENQERQLLSWINERGLHQQVTNMYKQLLFGPYSRYQNDAVKHGDDYSEDEAEFMIYLTGTFIRLLLQLRARVPQT